jgi:putative Mn2+ efflux pump MntP
MPLSELLLLGLDSFVASAVLAVGVVDRERRVQVAVLFGLGDALATVIGFQLWGMLSLSYREPLLFALGSLAACASFAAIVLLGWVAGQPEGKRGAILATYLLPILLSVDNLYAGHLLPGLHMNVWLWATLAGSVSAVLSLLGWACGSLAGALPRAERRAYALLGVLLVAAVTHFS